MRQMRRMNRRFPLRALPALLLALVALPALAERPLTGFPFEERFDDDGYARNLLFVNFKKGAEHAWEPTGGWRGGAARFTPPTEEGYSGLGQFTRLERIRRDLDQINIRFLIWHGKTFPREAPRNKLIIANRFHNVGKALRPMVLSGDSRYGYYYAPCHGTWCDGPGRDAQPFYVDDYVEQWVSIELEAKLKDEEINLYVHTPDGRVKGLIAQNRFIDKNDHRPLTDNPFSHIDGIGFYWSRVLVDPKKGYSKDTYLKIDELVISDRYIGPPEGFVGDKR